MPFGTDRRVLALAVARAVDAFGNSFIVLVLPLYIASLPSGSDLLGLPEAAAIGIVLSVLGLVNSGLQPFTGRASDRLGRRRALIITGLGLLAVANLGYIWATSYPALLGLRVLQGVALALAIPATLALITDLSEVGNRGTSMGLFNTFRLAGYAAGPLVAAWVVAGGPYAFPVAGHDLSLSGFEAAFLAASAAVAAGMVLVLWMVKDPPELSPMARSGTTLRIRSTVPDRWLDPVFILALATLVLAISISLIASLENEINAHLGQGPRAFGLQFSILLAPHLVLQAPVGRLADRWGRLPLVVAGMVLLVPSTLVQGYVTAPWEMVAARLGQGLASVLFFAPSLAMAGDLSQGRGAGSSLSLLSMAFGLGAALGPLAAGFLVVYGYPVPFLVGGVLAGIGAILTWTQLRETLVLQEEDRTSPTPGAP